MLKKRTFIRLLAVLALFFGVSVCSAQPVSMATGEWTPYTSAGMEEYGEFTRVVTIVFKEMGLEPEYHFYPWRRCFDAVLKGKMWAAFPYSYTEERAKKVWYSDPLSCSETVFFYYKDDHSSKSFHFDRLEDLKSYKVGGVTGYFYEEIFQKAGVEIDYVSKEINAIEKLKIGRIDLLPVNQRVGWNLIRTRFPEHAHWFKTLDKPLNVNSLRLIVSKDYPGAKSLLDRFNQALKVCIEKNLIELDTCE